MESVNVVARFRGPESDLKASSNWELSESTIKHKAKDHLFTLDSVLSPISSQSDLYLKAADNSLEKL